MQEPESADDVSAEPLELLITPPTEEQKKRAWRLSVLDRYHNCCANCGGSDHLIVDMLVPLAAGGQLVESNGVTICRACQLAAKAADKAAEVGKSKRRPVNVWISRALYERLTGSLEMASGFRSMGSLVRYMMERVVAHPDLFEDLANYQDVGMDVKINVWVEPAMYDAFKAVLVTRRLTVTDALKGLFAMYLETVVERKL
jgi:hypothetical protein